MGKSRINHHKEKDNTFSGFKSNALGEYESTHYNDTLNNYNTEESSQNKPFFSHRGLKNINDDILKSNSNHQTKVNHTKPQVSFKWV